jgi:hypothetical protein
MAATNAAMVAEVKLSRYIHATVSAYTSGTASLALEG